MLRVIMKHLLMDILFYMDNENFIRKIRIILYIFSVLLIQYAASILVLYLYLTVIKYTRT